ncbi:MAG: ATP synthase F1 subunit delta [Candidatus Velthaea sp.]
MPNETVARRYALAIFQLAAESQAVPQVGHDLHTVLEALRADDAVRRFFRSPVVDRKEKAAILARAFDRLNAVALHAVLLLVRKRREALFEQIVVQYDVLEQQSRGAAPLRVETARPLARADLDALVARLAALYNTKFDVTQSVDPQLIGGVRITMGDKRIDGSIAGRLDEFARMLSTN